jgi:hypothetical protein
VDLVLDGVFDREDVALGAVQFDQTRREGGGLSTAGGPGDEDDPILSKNELFDELSAAFGEPELLEFEDGPCLFQDTHDEALAVDRRDRRETDVDVLPGDLDLDPAILGEALFGDIEGAHDLDPGGDRGVCFFGLANDVVQHSVDPIADDQVLFKRFDVNIRSLLLDCSKQEGVDELDDGSVVLGGL